MEIEDKEQPKKTKNVYVETFSESIANFYLAAEKRSQTFPEFITGLRASKRSQASWLATDFLMAVTSNVRKIISCAQHTFGYEMLLDLKFNERFVPCEHNATQYQMLKISRSNVEEAGQSTMLLMEDVLKVLNKSPHNVGLKIDACEKMMAYTKDLAKVAVTHTYEYLNRVSDVKLLISSEQTRAKKELAVYKKQFPFLKKTDDEPEGSGQKRKSDESKSGVSSRPKIA